MAVQPHQKYWEILPAPLQEELKGEILQDRSCTCGYWKLDKGSGGSHTYSFHPVRCLGENCSISICCNTSLLTHQGLQYSTVAAPFCLPYPKDIIYVRSLHSYVSLNTQLSTACLHETELGAGKKNTRNYALLFLFLLEEILPNAKIHVCLFSKIINTSSYWGQRSYQKPEGKSRENCLLYDIWHGLQLPVAQEEFELYIQNPQVSSTEAEAQAWRGTVYCINLYAAHKFLCSALHYAPHQAVR